VQRSRSQVKKYLDKSVYMELLPVNDIQSLQKDIQKIYALQHSSTFAQDAITIIDRLIPSEVPCFHSQHLQTKEALYIFKPDHPGLTPELEKIRDDHFNEHPLVQRLPQVIDRVSKISDFISQSELHALEGLYQQFMRTIELEYQITFFLPNDNLNKIYSPVLTGVSLNRRQKDFSERDRLILELLRPHLFQAYCNVQKYQQLQSQLNQLQDSVNQLALVILDTEGRVQLITPQAASLLELYFPVSSILWQFPDQVWSWVKYQVTNIADTSDFSSVCLPLRIQQANNSLSIRLVIEQVNNRYLLLLEEQTSSLLDSIRLLGLSQRETEVLYWMMQGKDNKAIAAQLTVGISTVHKHLENIYQKWGVNSRGEAIAKTLKQLGLL
jgi:DNA-binding CsgD family transcriptional regulator